MNERKPNNLEQYRIQIAANIVAGTQWAWRRQYPEGISNPDEAAAVREAETMISNNQRKWKDFTDKMNA